jgi:hypothetical protein
VGAVATFGFQMAGGVDLTGDDIPDVVLGQPDRATVAGGDGKAIWVFDGSKLAAGAGPAGFDLVSVVNQTGDSTSWNGANGWVFDADFPLQAGVISVVGDFDGWMPNGKATPDIVATNGEFSRVTLFGNHSDDAQGFDLGSFPHADTVMGHPTLTSGFSMTYPRGGDVNGDGKVDIIVSSALGDPVIIH